MFDHLSEKQKQIVFSDHSRIIVRACPGSGKTYTVAAKFAFKLNNWRKTHAGIACVSFTNVAWKEVDKYLGNFNIKSPIGYPHFLGTLDSFINKYIFLPFGHLLMECNKRPKMVGEPYSPWNGRYFSESYFASSSFDINGDFIFTKSYPPPPKRASEAIYKAKNKLLKAGFANQDDANYFGLNILRKFPEITKALVKRFPVLIVDEAQDTTEIQMAIIDELIDNGLEEVVLVGDPDQAIFEWNTAKPKMFQTKCAEWQNSLHILDECRRSSKKICHFVHKLSSLDQPAVAVTPDVCDCEIEPEIHEYESLQGAVNNYLEKCKSNSIELSTENISILSRTKSGVDELVQIFDNQSVVKDTPINTFNIWVSGFLWVKDFGEGKFLIDNGLFKEGFKIIERGYFKATHQSTNFSTSDLEDFRAKIGIVIWRKNIGKLISNLPHTNLIVKDWLAKFSKVIPTEFGTTNLEDSVKKSVLDLPMRNLFSFNKSSIIQLPVRIGTIHSVKGETFEASLVIIKDRVKSTKYQTILKRIVVGEMLEEELRTLYVALTRARRVLILAVPKGESDMWNSFLLGE